MWEPVGCSRTNTACSASQVSTVAFDHLVWPALPCPRHPTRLNNAAKFIRTTRSEMVERFTPESTSVLSAFSHYEACSG